MESSFSLGRTLPHDPLRAHRFEKPPCGGRLSESWSLFGYTKYWGPYYDGDPTREDNSDILPSIGVIAG